MRRKRRASDLAGSWRDGGKVLERNSNCSLCDVGIRGWPISPLAIAELKADSWSAHTSTQAYTCAHTSTHGHTRAHTRKHTHIFITSCDYRGGTPHRDIRHASRHQTCVATSDMRRDIRHASRHQTRVATSDTRRDIRHAQSSAHKIASNQSWRLFLFPPAHTNKRTWILEGMLNISLGSAVRPFMYCDTYTHTPRKYVSCECEWIY